MRNTIIVFDFETGDKSFEQEFPAPYPLQIAAQVINTDRDSPYLVEGATFSEYMRPPISDDDINNPDVIKESALNKNGIKREEILEYPSAKIVWNNFTNFVLSHKKEGELPIAAGWNVPFDLEIANRLSKHYNTKRIFHENNTMDMMWIDWLFRCRDVEYGGRNFDLARLHYGIKTAEGERRHEASKDVKDTAMLLCRYLKFIWSSSKKNNYFKDAFA